MIRKLVSLLAITAVISACGNSGNKGTSDGEAASMGVTEVSFTALTENPDQFLDKDISLSGKVVHVCPHTGKKMFIVGDDPDLRLYITAGEEVPQFPQDLLGNEITVEGHLRRLAAGEQAMGEGEGMMGQGEGMMTEEGEDMAEGEVCETEAAVAAQPVLADLVLEYKSHSLK